MIASIGTASVNNAWNTTNAKFPEISGQIQNGITNTDNHDHFNSSFSFSLVTVLVVKVKVPAIRVVFFDHW